ncbi:hypothetical protein H4R20_005283 [Coemansia guatemalensis]|uniref:Sfi1 spindle body domain-containing protein n=1 Tax=Coemansia guatemalensis TaxID=2761395 RepID=A0A9W8LQY1_9FUNG|nr:hypothetical protein H4R20_005283 [Coemansia guatemalensis]
MIAHRQSQIKRNRYKGKADIALLMMIRRWRAMAVASSNRREELVAMWREAFAFRQEIILRRTLNTWREQLHKKMQTEDYRYRHTQMKLAEMHDRQRVLRMAFDKLVRHRDLKRRLEFWQKEQDEALAQQSFNILREAAAEKRLDRQLGVLEEQISERRQRRTVQQCLAAWREMAAERAARARRAQEQADNEAEAQATKRVLRDLLLGWRDTAMQVAQMEDEADEHYARTLATTALEKLNTVAIRYAHSHAVFKRYSKYMTMYHAFTTLREQFEVRRQASEEAQRQASEQTQALEAADHFHRTNCLQRAWDVWRQATRARRNEHQQSRVLRDWTRRRVQRKRRVLLMAWHAMAAKQRANELRAQEFQANRREALLKKCFAGLLKRCSFVPRKPGVADAQTMTSFASEPRKCDRGTSAVADSLESTGLAVQQRVPLYDTAEAGKGPATDRGASLSVRGAELSEVDVPGRSKEPGPTLDAHSITVLRSVLAQWRTVAQQHAQQEAQADEFAEDRRRAGNRKLCLAALRRWRIRFKQKQQLGLAADKVYKRSVVRQLLLRMTVHSHNMQVKREEADQLRRRYLLTTVWLNLLTVADQRAAERAQRATHARIVEVSDDAGNPGELNALELAPIPTQDDGALPDGDLALAYEPDAAMVSIANSVEHRIVEVYFSAWRELAAELRAAENAFGNRGDRTLLENCFHKLRKAMPTSADSAPAVSVPAVSDSTDPALTDAEREAALHDRAQQLREIVERNAKRHTLHRWMVVTRGKLMENRRLAKTTTAFVRAAAERGRLALAAKEMARERLLRKVLAVWRTRTFIRRVKLQDADARAEGSLAYKCISHWVTLTRARLASRLQSDSPQNEGPQLEAPQTEQHPPSSDRQPAKRTGNSQYERALAFRWEKQMRHAFDALMQASSDDRIRVHVAQRSSTREEDLMAIADGWNNKRILRNALRCLHNSTKLHTQHQQLMIRLADAWANTNLKRKAFAALRSRISPDSSMFGSAIDNDFDA